MKPNQEKVMTFEEAARPALVIIISRKYVFPEAVVPAMLPHSYPVILFSCSTKNESFQSSWII